MRVAPRHHHRGVAHPNHPPIFADHAIFRLKTLAAFARFLRRLHHLVVSRMHVLRPRPRIHQPVFRRESEHRLYLRTDV